jgi:hypothetical protein
MLRLQCALRWVGEKPDTGTCQSALAYHLLHRGTIDGLDVSGLTTVGRAASRPASSWGGWTLMLPAMMLPTILPLLAAVWVALAGATA